MAASVTAKLNLDASGFTATLTKARASLGKLSAAALPAIAAGFAAAAAAAGGLAVGLKGALDAGGALSELSARTGVAAGQLRVLQEAFARSGLSAEQVGPAVNKLQRAIVEASTGTGPAAKAFQSLGLSVDGLRGMSAASQFEIIGQAIASLPDPAARAAAAMQIFGRSGGELLALFSNSGAMAESAKAIGAQASILTRNADMFDKASDILNGIGVKLQGFFVGVADNLVPALMPLLEAVDQIDLSGLGQELGNAVAFGLAAIQSGLYGDLLTAQFVLAAKTFTNQLYRGIIGTGAAIVAVFKTLPQAILSSLKAVGSIGDTLVGDQNVFGKLSDLVANALIYATTRYQVALLSVFKDSIQFYLSLFGFATSQSTSNLQKALASTIQFFASDFALALQNPVAFFAKNFVSSLSKAAAEVSTNFADGFNADAGSFIDKTFAGLNSATENSRQNMLQSAKQLIDVFASAGQSLSNTVAQGGSQLLQNLIAAYNKASSETGDLIDTEEQQKRLKELKAAITAIQQARKKESQSKFNATKTQIPSFDDMDLAAAASTPARTNAGIIAQSLQQVGGGAAFARFSDAANPAAQAVREQQKTNGLLSRIEQKLTPQMALMPA